MTEFTFEMTFAGSSDYIRERCKVMADTVPEAFAKVLAIVQHRGDLRTINLIDIF
jgi:hypothetical protein